MLKWYLIICAAMLAIMYLVIIGYVVEFKKRHPNAKFQRNSRIKTLADFVKTAVAFLIPVFNVILFFTIVFVIDEEKVYDIIKEKCESY
jgi:TRAP-type uncharacterized transport system fused permease subunit